MAFSMPNTPFFPIYNPHMGTDPVSAQKALEFRQHLASLQNPQSLEFINSLLSSHLPKKLTRHHATRQPVLCPPINPFLTSPGWLQHALTSGLHSLSGSFLNDFCMPPLPGRRSETNRSALPNRPNKKVYHTVNNRNKKSPPTDLQRSDSNHPDFNSTPTFFNFKEQSECRLNSWPSSEIPKVSNSLQQLQDTGTLVPSLIDGEVIMGFNVWGEKRLCLPHLFRFVLNDVDLKAIDDACTKLQITCTTCTINQLTLLHSRKILPPAVSSCGLIRKSDAERLIKFIHNRTGPTKTQNGAQIVCDHREDADAGSIDLVGTNFISPNQRHGSLKDINHSKNGLCSLPKDQKSSESHRIKPDTDGDNQHSSSHFEVIPVIHECFGRQLGLIHPELYSEPNAKCIECQSCRVLFAPEQFVGHTHTVTEVDNVNHWGFDSTNWRCYLRLYSGRCSRHRSPKSFSIASEPTSSEDETDDSRSDIVGPDMHRRLEEFKIKFARPIRLPASLSAALRTVGLCASVAPIPPAASVPTSTRANTVNIPVTKDNGKRISCCLSTPSLSPSSKINSPNNVPFTAGSSNKQSTIYSSFLPQLTLRRLWAPNDGRIKLPPPPTPITNCDRDILPKTLHTGPPQLLRSDRVIPQTAADQYDRDFIPNVCLMPPFPTKPRKRSSVKCRRHRERNRARLPSAGSRSRSSSGHHSSASCTDDAGGGSVSSSRTRSLSSTSSSSRFSWISKRQRSSSSFKRSSSRDPRSSSPSRTSLRHRLSQSSSNVLIPDTKSGHKFITLSNSYYFDSLHHRHTVINWSNSRKRIRYNSLPPLRIKSHFLRRTKSQPLISASAVHAHTLNVSKKLRIANESRSQHKKHCCSPLYGNHSENIHRQNRAMAAAKAAQGAASRSCTGIWSRHFAHLNRSLYDPLHLPSARAPASTKGTDTVTCETSTGNGNVPTTGNINGDNFDINGSTNMYDPRYGSTTTPVLVTNPLKNSLPAAVLALESIWADWVRHLKEYTIALETQTGVSEACQRLFEQLANMQSCYASHLASLMEENQKLTEELNLLRQQKAKPASVSRIASTTSSPSLKTDATFHNADLTSKVNSQFSYTSLNRSGPTRVQSTSRQTTPPQRLYPHRNRKEPSRPSVVNGSHGSMGNGRRSSFSHTPSDTTCLHSTPHSNLTAVSQALTFRSSVNTYTPQHDPPSVTINSPVPSTTTSSLEDMNCTPSTFTSSELDGFTTAASNIEEASVHSSAGRPNSTEETSDESSALIRKKSSYSSTLISDLPELNDQLGDNTLSFQSKLISARQLDVTDTSDISSNTITGGLADQGGSCLWTSSNNPVEDYEPCCKRPTLRASPQRHSLPPQIPFVPQNQDQTEQPPQQQLMRKVHPKLMHKSRSKLLI